MANSISFGKSKPSKLKRLPFLPRFGFTIDVAGMEFNYRYAPIAETLMNMDLKSFSLKALVETSMKQLKEIKISPDLDATTSAQDAISSSGTTKA